MSVLIILAIVVGVIALLLLLPITLSFQLRYNTGTEGGLILKYALITLFKKDIPDEPELDTEDKKPKKKKSKEQKSGTSDKKAGKRRSITADEIVGFAKQNLTEIKRMIGAVLKFILTRSIKIKRLKLRLVLGVDDAMTTAMLFGTVSALVFNSVALMDRHMRLGKHSINIKPAFNEPHIFAETEAVVSTCIFNLLAIVVIALWYAVPIAWRFRKEIIKNGKSDQRSDPVDNGFTGRHGKG